MSWSTPQKRFARLVYVVGFFVVVSFVAYSIPELGSLVRATDSRRGRFLDAIRNETLGVEKIFAINLPTRPDKRDSIILRSSLSGFHVDWIDGVKPDQISPLSYPYNWNHDHAPSEYAARRAHVDAMQQIVDKGIGSAIIMEDDLDWDVTIKTQLQNLAIALRALQGTGLDVSRSPYGDDWDIIWLGHCGIQCHTNDPFFLTPGDPTILPPHHFLPYWRDPPPFSRPDDTRLTCAASDGVCSVVYAVSYRGAQKILSALSVNPTGLAEQIDIGAQFDVSLGRMCGSNYLRCYTTYPSLTGGSATSSDIHASGDGQEKGGARPSSFGVLYSTLLNVNRILSGEPTVHATWDDAKSVDVAPEDIPVLGGVLHVPGEGGLHAIPFDPPL
ncbi:hypothetical protein P168DRAFT_271585 [Aspergillus campestris IBT 28561]|uniref:LPS glycosyltransferase n=1 Tax=Aspergillus campestris (strain IBT 28561) TaxID=1392248 RepID=A0A2I1D0N3_ASPC2|nr:uncharacterized protein P168DRAFT_271585 [Aspergillus campestris IBT 28561]PKY03435.1 hypothetical protein P168DRAFT_271585 [Aspergillus campestris IBT 28561]